MAILQMKGDIVPNDYGWIYEWFGLDYTSPAKAKAVIDALSDGEELEVHVNSPGGDVASGQELYSLFASVPTSVAYIEGMAASAAGFASMGCNRVHMSAVASIMIHNVWCSGVSGDYHDMDKASRMLKSLNESICHAYAKKSGRSLDEIMKLMDRETWLSAEKAKEYGFIDDIYQSQSSSSLMLNGLNGLSITEEMIKQATAAREKAAHDEAEKEKLLSDLFKYGV